MANLAQTNQFNELKENGDVCFSENSVEIGMAPWNADSFKGLNEKT